MAGARGEISSLHLAIAAGGGVLLYAGLRGVSVVQALRDITSGSPPGVSTEGKVVTTWRERGDLPTGSGSTDWNGVYRKANVPAALRRPVAFVAALSGHATEKYSKERRWAKGYSDCSSFAGKGLLDAGITPPGASNTTAYLSSPDWVRVSTPRMGDIAVNSQHMAVFTDGANGIGQQNPARDVRRDTMDNLMANSGPWQIRRYRGWA